MKWWYLLVSLIFLGLCASLDTASYAKDSSRQKVIDFDGDVVEGVNKRPLDSLSHITDEDKKMRRAHLYKKRGGFRSENIETLRLMRFQQ